MYISIVIIIIIIIINISIIIIIIIFIFIFIFYFLKLNLKKLKILKRVFSVLLNFIQKVEQSQIMAGNGKSGIKLWFKKL